MERMKWQEGKRDEMTSEAVPLSPEAVLTTQGWNSLICGTGEGQSEGGVRRRAGGW